MNVMVENLMQFGCMAVQYFVLIISLDQPVGVVVYGGSIPRPMKSQGRQRLATAAMFPRRCVSQALSRRDGLRYSLRASA